MHLYRISWTKYAKDLTGRGARLYGGRWSNVGTSCIYTSETRALAMLEYSANVPLEYMPRDLSIITYKVPENFEALSAAQLPHNWQELIPPSETKDLGTGLLKAAKQLLVKVPSIIIPAEFNYIINPAHPDIDKVKIAEVRKFDFDTRLKK